MRTLASILLLVGVVLQLLLGALYLMSARYEPVGKTAATQRRFSAGRQVALGGTVLGGGACGLAAALLAMRRRRPGRITLALGGASGVGPLGALLADGLLTVAVIALCLVALALGGLALSRRRAAEPASSS